MQSDPVELTKQIKAASNIVDVVGSYLAIKPVGTTYKALCPFHNDSRPSLDIDPKRQRFRCWSCGAYGDVFAFVERMEKVRFPEAQAILAVRAGIKLDTTTSAQDYHKTRLLEVMKWAQARFQHCLLETPVGAEAVKYIASRKIKGSVLRDFGLGFAPATLACWLGEQAEADGTSLDALVEVGLLAPRPENRGLYDRFRDRVMFPIRDIRGQVIGFGGRILPDSPYAARAPKYYNSSETPLFSKSDVLFGLDMARHAGAAAGYLAVVEGYTDVMMAHQCGIPQVVATMGTALNARHVSQLRRTVAKVILVYDADAGGSTGVDRALEIFVSHDVELAIATLPDGLDPCDLLVRSGGADTFNKVLASAVDALDFKLNRLLERGAGSSVEGTRRVVDEILGIMAAAPNLPSRAAQVKQELIVTRVAHRLGLRQETVWARLGDLRAERRTKEQLANQKSATAPGFFSGSNGGGNSNVIPPASAGDAAMGDSPRSGQAMAAERQLLELLLADPALVPQAAQTISPAEITHTGLRRLLAELYTAQAAGLVPDIDALRTRLADRQDLFEAALKLQFVGQHMQNREHWLGRILKRFAEFKAEAEQRALKNQLTGASDEQVPELFRKLQQEYLNRKRMEPPRGDSSPSSN